MAQLLRGPILGDQGRVDVAAGASGRLARLDFRPSGVMQISNTGPFDGLYAVLEILLQMAC